jgi:hypothetical protein
MESHTCRVARGARQIADAQRVRWRVYGDEERLLPSSTSVAGREIDGRDEQMGTIHLLVYAGTEPVGTVRLLPARPERAASGCLGLDLEGTFDLRGCPRPGMVAAEVTRYCVLRRYRCTGVTRALYLALRAESRRRGITHWFSAANMETDCAEDAALAYELVRTRGLLDDQFRAEPRLGPPCHTPRRRSCYTDEQRRSARRGQLGSLAIPRTLALFATKMGARYIGPPAYDRYFNVFSLPLVAALVSDP